MTSGTVKTGPFSKGSALTWTLSSGTCYSASRSNTAGSVWETPAPLFAPGEIALAEPAGLTSEAFVAWLGERRIDVEYARAIAGRMFPGVARLDDHQRALLRDELAKED